MKINKVSSSNIFKVSAYFLLITDENFPGDYQEEQ